jgi:hypothetical protein
MEMLMMADNNSSGGTVVLGCDSNGMNDEAFMSAVQSKLESAGYTVEKLGIAPGPFADYSYSSSATGKYGVYLMADSIVSIADYSGATGGANSGGNSFKMAVFGIRTDVIPKLAGDGWNKYPISPDSDCTDVCNKIAHKTYPEIEEICKQDTRIVSGSTGEEMGEAIVKALGGQTNDNDGGSASTIKEAIKEVLSAWDGEVEAYIRDDTMYAHKIKLPEQDCDLILAEGLNILVNSVSIKDYCPNNTNKLVVHWVGGEDIIIQNSTLIERFGEKSKELEAIKRVLKEDEENNNSENGSTDEKNNNGVGYVEVPAETYDEALEFARLEWNKIKRESCHEVELATAGSSEWRQGKWCYLQLDSFDIHDYYYIHRVSQNISSNEWKCNLTLKPYPDSFGKPKEDNKKETEDKEEDKKEDKK